MCFANAVLQLLVYSPPFWKLFNELGRMLTEGNENERVADGETPLVDATIRFLKEFGPVKKEVVNGKRSNGKGKEIEMEEELDGVDSFIPAYVYEALKDNKRFDNMRVRIIRGRQVSMLTLYM